MRDLLVCGGPATPDLGETSHTESKTIYPITRNPRVSMQSNPLEKQLHLSLYTNFAPVATARKLNANALPTNHVVAFVYQINVAASR
jgi:hypothetical protein